MKQKTDKSPKLDVLSLAWSLGYTIALPLVAFAFLGRFADNYFNTSPWLLLAGILISIVVSSIGVYYKSKQFIEESPGNF